MKSNVTYKRVMVGMCVVALVTLTTVPLYQASSTPYSYMTYLQMTSLLHQLQQNHSAIMSLESHGTTFEGREVWFVKLSDNVSVDESEPGVLLMGAHHGNEKISYEVLVYFIKYMVETYEKPNTDDDGDGLVNEDIIDGFDNDADGSIDEDPSEDRVREVFNNTQIFLFPMVSPDGVEANSRKNCVPNYGPFGFAREITSYGVNLNRNYDDPWLLAFLLPGHYMLPLCILDSSFNYRGPRPFSEVETQAVKQLAETYSIAISASYHSGGQFMIFPWMHTSLPTRDEATFVSIGENMSRINKFPLYTGGEYIIPRFSGTLGTSENWLYRECGIISFTMELYNQYAPQNPDVVLDLCYTNIGVDLYLCERSLMFL